MALSSLPSVLAEVLARLPKPRTHFFNTSSPAVAAAGVKLCQKDGLRETYIFETVCDALDRSKDLNVAPAQSWSEVIKDFTSSDLNPLKLVAAPTFTAPTTKLQSRHFVPCSPLLIQTRQYSTRGHPERDGANLARLEKQAERLSKDANAQFKFLEALLPIDPWKVIMRVENKKYNCDNSDCLAIYKRALEERAFRNQSGGNRQSGGDGLTTFQTEMGVFVAKTLIYIAVAAVIFVYIIPKFVKFENITNSKNDFTGEIPKETFDDVAGIDSAVEEMKELVNLLGDTSKFSEMGCKIPKGYLLTGPPGVGKTLLARALAGEANVPFFHATGSDFDEMFVGVGASRMRKLFAAAKASSPSIIFIDEIDSIGGKRGDQHNGVYKATLNQLLSEMDGFDGDSGVIVIAATNMADKLDSALVRTGRFDHKIAIRPPNKDGRHEILKVHTFNKNLSPDVDLEDIAKATPGMTGSDLATIVNTATLRAISQGKEKVEQDDLEYGRAKTVMGAVDKSVKPSRAEMANTAHHEAGHAAMLLINKSSKLNIYIATIQARGNTLGHVFQVPNEDMYSQSIDDLIGMIDICLGGRIAEELYLGDIKKVTTGCSADMSNATRIAEALVGRNGYSKKIGYARIDETGFSCNETHKIIQDEVRELLNERYEYVKKVLKQHESNWKRLSNTLLEYETLTGEECKLIWDGYTLSRGPEDGIPSSAAR